jgi:amino acid adenylation domain-containing protein
VLMARLSGQDDVVIGTPVANRQRREVEALIGFFLNTLALRVRADDGASVADVLAITRDTVLAAYAHQDVPFEHVLEAVQPVRSLSHNPLFQTMLTLNNVPTSSAGDLRGLAIAPMPQAQTSTYCDLYLSLREGADGVEGSLIYATDLFDRATIQRILGSFELLLQGMVADDGADILRLPVVDAAELALQWDEWNRSEQDFPLERGYIALFEEQVRLHPLRIAASDAGERLTYRELDARADRLAQALVEAGAKRETLVVLMCERSVLLLTMMLAVFKAGAAFLPLDVKHPPARLLEIVEASRSPLLLVSEPLHERVLAMTAHLPLATLVAETLGTHGDVRHVGAASAPDSLAYVIFTSGSTGKPKGAMVEQRGMLNHMFGKLSSLEIGPDDVLAQTASPAFDICVWQFLAALLVGARTVVLEDAIAFDPERLLEAVEREGVSVLQTVPSMMCSLLDACSDAVTLRALRVLVPTGEALGTRLSQDWLARFPAIPLANMYGPAECSDDVTWQAIRTRPADGSSIPIGRPTANNRIYILDRRMQPVPIGIKGEICVDGIGVGRGYLHDAVQTAAAFPPHPLGRPGRFYRTGDVGRLRPDGVIEFHGRLDFQVKVRGLRIELAEIEAALADCAGVSEAVVVAREDAPGEKRLVAYLAGTPPDAAALRQQLGARLPDYMVPTAFVTLARLPTTPNGKLDRKALPAPDFAALSGRPYAAPEGEIEETLAGIWQALLGGPRVGRNDHFFELGGSSLLASQVVVRMRKTLGIDVPLMQVFQAPVLHELADGIVQAELKKFEAADVDVAGAAIEALSDEEVEAMLAEERRLRTP